MVVSVRRLALLAILTSCVAAAPAKAANRVFVCGKDLCSASDDRSGKVRLTRDGAGGPYSSPACRAPASGSRTRGATSATTDSSPVFSPDGRRVAFERRGSIFTVRVAGSRPQRLLRAAREPSWSR
jgi:hypothetical protein